MKFKQPNPNMHAYVSFIKSGFRFAAGGILILVGGSFVWAGVLLVLAEAVGIIEELV